MSQFEKHESKHGNFYVGPDGTQYQEYVNDQRFKDFMAAVEAGEHTIVDHVPDLSAKEEVDAAIAVGAEEQASLRALIPLVIELADGANISNADLDKLKERSTTIETEAAKIRGNSSN